MTERELDLAILRQGRKIAAVLARTRKTGAARARRGAISRRLAERAPADEAGAPLAKRPRRLSLLDMCRKGVWWCQGCRRVTVPRSGGPVPCCSRCGASEITYTPPAWRDTHERQPDLYREWLRAQELLAAANVLVLAAPAELPRAFARPVAGN